MVSVASERAVLGRAGRSASCEEREGGEFAASRWADLGEEGGGAVGCCAGWGGGGGGFVGCVEGSGEVGWGVVR